MTVHVERGRRTKGSNADFSILRDVKPPDAVGKHADGLGRSRRLIRLDTYRKGVRFGSKPATEPEIVPVDRGIPQSRPHAYVPGHVENRFRRGGSDAHVSVSADEQSGNVVRFEIGDGFRVSNVTDIYAESVIRDISAFYPCGVIGARRSVSHLESRRWDKAG